MKGIILAGGEGTRLRPCTTVVGKQLLPVYDKPMIYYPLSTLIHAGVTEVLIVTTPKEINNFKELLSDGSQFGISIDYKVQDRPNGVPEGIVLAEEFLNGESFWFILGDNLFHGPEFGSSLKAISHRGSPTIFAYHVSNPESYGVVVMDKAGNVLDLIEKPDEHISNWAIPGIYFLDKSSVEIAKNLRKSTRGETEIVEVLKSYIESESLICIRTSRGNTWLDLGTSENLLAASNFVHTLQIRQGLLVGSPEEAAINAGLVTYESILSSIPKNSHYGDVLLKMGDSHQ